jgi:hypothetical protein
MTCMSKEQEQRPQEVSLENVIRRAKEIILHDGVHLPTVIADGSARTAITQFAEFAATHEGRVQQMLVAGFVLSQTRQVGRLRQVFFISEGWMSVAEEGKLPDRLPSQDPNRKEILFVSCLKVRSHEVRLVMFEMVRDDEGHLTELKESQPAAGGSVVAESPLLTAFVAGFDMGTGETIHKN